MATRALRRERNPGACAAEETTDAGGKAKGGLLVSTEEMRIKTLSLSEMLIGVLVLR